MHLTFDLAQRLLGGLLGGEPTLLSTLAREVVEADLPSGVAAASVGRDSSRARGGVPLTDRAHYATCCVSVDVFIVSPWSKLTHRMGDDGDSPPTRGR